MADQNGAGAVSGAKTVTLPENGSAHLDVSSANIKSMTLDGHGGLVITLKDGTMMPTIANFHALAQNNASIALSDGNTIDTHSLSRTLAAKDDMSAAKDATAANDIMIDRPKSGETVSMDLQRAHNYVLPDLTGAKFAEKGGAMIITFQDRGVLILDHVNVMSGKHAAHLVYDDKTFNLHQFETAFHIQHNAHNTQVASNDLDQMAQQLANQQPGAGTPTGALAASAGGYGFQSSVAAAELFGRAPIGPIDPTDLAFGIPTSDHKLPEQLKGDDETPAGPPPHIIITVNGSGDLAHIPDAVVKEDHTIDVPLTASLQNPSSATEALTVVVSGIPANVGTVTPHDGGVYDAAAGTITYTLAPGADLNTVITFAPKGNSDIDFGQLHVSASANDATLGTITSDTNVYITTDAVADVPTVNAAPATDQAGHTTALNITTAVTDTDGSETITKITVSGLPAGATLNHGTLSNGVYTLSPADLTGLTVTVPKSAGGTVDKTYNLTVTTYNAESNLSGREADYSDNTNHASTTLVLTVTPTGVPHITSTSGNGDAGDTDLEHAIGTPAATITDKVTFTYGSDGPGAITANGTFTASGSEANGHLTSNGQAVTVTEANGTYTGQLADGSTVFTLSLDAAGNYTFTLDKPLDHAVAGNDNIALHFGVTVTDADGDAALGTITVNIQDDVPVAHNDVNSFTGALNAVETGNVVLGTNEQAGGADTLSKDVPNTVTQVTFNGTTMAVPAAGNATIAGTFGTLSIDHNGEYTYKVTHTGGTDTFSYTLKDEDGDTSTATLKLENNQGPPTILITVNGSGDLAHIPDAVVKEDGTVNVPLTAQLQNPSSATEALTVVVSGLPGASVGTVTPHDGGVYNAANGTITYTLAPGASLNTTIGFTPVHNSDVDFGNLTVTATAQDAVTGTVSATGHVYVTTDAVADVPTITAQAASDEQNHTTALNISTAVTDTDGSETITKITISGLPTGATLNHGTQDANGVYTLTPAQLTGLTVTVPNNAATGPYNLTVTTYNAETNLSGKEVDTSDNTNNNHTTLVLTVTPHGAPTIDPTGGDVNEGGLDNMSSSNAQNHAVAHFALLAAAAAPTGGVTTSGQLNIDYGSDGPGSVHFNSQFNSTGGELNGKLSSDGAPVTVTEANDVYTGKLADGTVVFTMTLVDQNDYSFTLYKPLDHQPGDNSNIVLNFGAIITDGNGDTANGMIPINIIDDKPVAHDDAISFYNHNGSASGNVVTGMNETAGGADKLSADAPNTVTKVQFGATSTTVPAGAAGATIQGDHGSLTIHADGSYTYTPKSDVTAAVSDKFTYTLTDFDGDNSTAVLTVTENATPTIIITVNGSSDLAHIPDAVVKEDGTINVPVTAQLQNPSSATEALTVVVSGIPSTVGTVTPHDGGVYNAANGTITYTLAPGASLNTTIGFTPKGNSDVDFGNLTVTATAQDVNTGTISTSGNVYVTTDAVADVPTVTAAAASDQAGHTTSLNIATAVTDTDGSETITKVTVSGLPTGATLNHGTVDANGVYTLTVAQLTGLTVTVPKTTAANTYNLTVTTYNSESKLSGKEADTSDNTNHNQTTLALTVTPNSVPTINAIGSLSDKEHDIGTNAATVTGHITVNYGTDTPGTLKGYNSFSASGSELNGKLTSDGQTVAVTYANNVYTGKTPDGTTVFSLNIGTDGTYNFTLNKPLDHATAGNDAIALKFGVQATDADGDYAKASIVIKVIDDVPVAHNDVNSFTGQLNSVQTGNVVTGANEATGGADALSKDAPNAVTQVTFGTTTVAIPATGTTSITGTNGVLTIAADGSYSYKVTHTGGTDTFGYTLKDYDGDISTATLKLANNGAPPTVIVTVNGSSDLAHIPDAVVKEDHSVDMPLTAKLVNPSSATEALTVVVSGIPSNVGTVTPHDGGVYNAANGTITYTLAPGSDLNTVITFTPKGNSDVDFGTLHVSATAQDVNTGTVSASGDVYVTTDAVADVPTITAQAASDEQNHTAALNISTAVTDTDGSETITKITISGLPTGATLNHGTADANGVYTLTPAQLTGLTVTVPNSTPANTYNLTVTTYNAESNLSGKEADTSDNTNLNHTTLALTVTPHGSPVINPTGGTVDEGGLGNGSGNTMQAHAVAHFAVLAAAAPTGGVTTTGMLNIDYGPDGPGSVHFNNEFSSAGPELNGKLSSDGAPVTVTEANDVYTGKLADGTVVFTMTLVDQNDYSFTLYKPLDHQPGQNGNIVLNFGAIITDGNGDTANGAIPINIVDDKPVAHDDTVSFYGHAGSVTANVVTGTGETAGGADRLSADAPNTVTNIQFGTHSVAVTAAGATIAGDHGSLTIHADGSYTYTPTTASNGAAVSDQFTYTLTDFDGDNSTAKLTVTENGTPTIIITVNGSNDLAHIPDAVVKEDGTINVPVTAQLQNPSSATEALTVVISGLPGANVGTVTPHDGGVYNAANGTITYTLAPGASLNTTIGFTPVHNSDVDFGNLTVTATAQDVNTGTISATGNLYVTTDAVADVPVVTAQAATDEAGNTAALNISTAVTDTDGSETITKVTVSGLPAGATLNHGTADANGVYTLTVAQLTGLTVTVPKTAAAQTYNLTVTTYNSESKLSGKEADTSDNTNHNQTTLALTVTPNGVPVLHPTGGSVDEHNIGGTGGTVTGTTAVTSADGHGAITTNGVFTSSGSEANNTLTSGGQPVTVTHTDTGYTGHTPDGTTVFVLTVGPDGGYTFTLDQPLDNAVPGKDVINLNFGVQTTDNNGDTGNGTITINVADDVPVAHDDVNSFNGGKGAIENGNVITGTGETAGGADVLSKDMPNTVSSVTFGGHTVAVPTGATGATIAGTDGTLVIHSDGSYAYTVTTPGATTDTFSYTLKDSDGDTSTANLTLSNHLVPPTTTITVDNGQASEYVKEDYYITLPIKVTTVGDGTQHVTSILADNIPAGWTVDGPWVATGVAGEYRLDVSGNHSTVNTTITLTPPLDSDADINDIHFTSNVTQGGLSSQSNADLKLIVDAVADIPNAHVPAQLTVQYNVWQGGIAAPLPISAKVYDVDGSENITFVKVNLNTVFSGLNPNNWSLADMGVTLNEGTQVSKGIWVIPINAMNGTPILKNLQLLFPQGNYNDPNWVALHPHTLADFHNSTIQVTIETKEVHLSGQEVDYSDNVLDTTYNVGVQFGLTPLVVDMNGNGFDLTTKDHGVLFDMTNDGKADQTGWVAPTDGLLVMDHNGNGVIDNASELFGQGSTSGFQILGQYDSNHDGVIDAKDTGLR